ncbi:GFA family protein [Sphingopyxis sp. OPL5]|uniref:GFA family protein n=1 Tax=Sphingopyxis sp. OPL5 TaxID=2486273 RepID=UPI00164CE44A|nr:GFA family protein [Sphingopyxis sp. OPL5]QNO27227.1 GFA family protein [Sphingopyxis sp. OPL5]
MSKTFSGGCQCGGVRYQVEGEPVMVANCFCRDCRSASGGAGSTVAVFPADGFALDRGSAIGYTSDAASGKSLTRNFCSTCGSRLFTDQIESFPGMVMIALGSLEDGHGLAPTMNIFGKDMPVWAAVNTALPTSDAMPG